MRSGVLWLLGAGGHGKVVADCALRTEAWSEVRFVDRRWPGLQNCGPWRVVGSDESLLATRSGSNVFIAIGDGRLRLEWCERVIASGFALQTIVHPRAIVSDFASMGAGGVVMPGAVVNAGARLARACIVNTLAVVEHDCVLESAVHICPGAQLAGNVHVGERAWVGIGSSVRQGVRIGRDAVIGAGAVVVDDVADSLTVAGNPARAIRTLR